MEITDKFVKRDGKGENAVDTFRIDGLKEGAEKIKAFKNVDSVI